MSKRATLVLVCLLSLLSNNVFSKGTTRDFNVVFINPGHPNNNPTGNFWLHVSQFMQAAAHDLNIELTTLYASRNHILMKTLIDTIINDPPDYIMLVNEKDVAINLIKKITSHNIPVFMLLNNVSTQEQLALSPKQRKLIYGSVVPNNYQVGQRLLSKLIEKHQQRLQKQQKSLSLLALQGDYITPASIARKKGLLDSIPKYGSLNFIDSSVANWSKNQAYQKVKGLLKRNHIDLIWAANDPMAFGAKQAVEEANLDYPVIIGGINWDLEDPHYPVDISYGGHVTLGVKALSMLKDIHYGKLSLYKRHQVIDIFTPSDSPFYQAYIQRANQGLIEYYDFSRFSLTAEQSYLPFSIENLHKVFSTHQ
ncbi:ABC transporter substrate-binding protein [Thalassotalea sediminis]|uniref:ABC transporter substrate-binding protein n=1 Tax=Thalassotalea sediminis TaxID=1759089 RepID=UPI0025725D2E|nr:ABC transporter substrate-binding protein [Thalassotalea sediminis]